VQEHVAILNAILNGNAEEAETLARAHMSAAREARLAIFLQANR
jgi:DNA-binding GntR family transcriptional regulator